jgi:hypothetical protein
MYTISSSQVKVPCGHTLIYMLYYIILNSTRNRDIHEELGDGMRRSLYTSHNSHSL